MPSAFSASTPNFICSMTCAVRAREGFVHHQQPRQRHQAAADCQHLLFAPTRACEELVLALRQPREQLRKTRSMDFAGPTFAEDARSSIKVLQDREVRETRGVPAHGRCRGLRVYASACPPGSPPRPDVAGLDRKQTADGVDHRLLTEPLGPAEHASPAETESDTPQTIW